MQFLKELKFSLILLLIYLPSIMFCLEESSILLFPFKTKSLQKEEDSEDWVEPYQQDGDSPYVLPKLVFNASQFINRWFYNGLYIMTNINSRSIESYLNMENSKLSIEKCNLNRIYTPNRDKSYYKPLNSDSYTKIENNIGNDVFSIIGDLHYKTKVTIGEKGNGLNFYFKEDDNNEDLCGNLGFNIDTKLDKTNLISQLKKKNYINEYIWTIKYLLPEEGTIIIGSKPHFFNTNSFYMSQYCEMKAIQNQSPETAWSFQLNEIRIVSKDSKKYILSDKKVDFLPDRGLIIGTNEYKKKIDEIIFNDLINKGICFSEVASFADSEKKTNENYYIYYCNKNSFIENKYTLDKTYYNTFPSLEFYIKESNMTFSLTKEHLFHEIYERVYFLVVFKKTENANKIWKLGEPFISHFQLTFDQEKKIVGFYNPVMPRIKNEDYMKEIQQKNVNNSDNNKTIIYVIIIFIVLVIVFAGFSYFMGKKLNEKRKRKANELNDEDFEYSTSTSINSSENPIENTLGIKKYSM